MTGLACWKASVFPDPICAGTPMPTSQHIANYQAAPKLSAFRVASGDDATGWCTSAQGRTEAHRCLCHFAWQQNPAARIPSRRCQPPHAMDGSAPLSHTEQHARTHPSNSYHNQPTCVQVLCTLRAFPTNAYDHPLTPTPPNTAAF